MLADGIATIALNRPHVLNAMNAEMMHEMRRITAAVERDASVRTVVVGGEAPVQMW